MNCNDFENELDLETVLREDFDEEDFLNNEKLYKILEITHGETISNKIENKFYRLYVLYKKKYPHIFSCMDFDILYNILYESIIKSYNCEILYKDYNYVSNVLIDDMKKEQQEELTTQSTSINQTIKFKRSGDLKSSKITWANLVKN